MKTAFFHCFGDFLHAVDWPTRVICVYLGLDQIVHIIWAVHHDLAHQHVLHIPKGSIIPDTMEPLMSFEEVRKGGFVVSLMA